MENNRDNELFGNILVMIIIFLFVGIGIAFIVINDTQQSPIDRCILDNKEFVPQLACIQSVSGIYGIVP